MNHVTKFVFWFLVVWGASFGEVASAQTRADITAACDALLPTNGAGAITAAALRSCIDQNIAASAYLADTNVFTGANTFTGSFTAPGLACAPGAPCSMGGWKVSGLSAENSCGGYLSQALCALPARTVVVSIASPAVFTLAAHGLSVGDYVMLTTTGALPTGLAINTQYCINSVTTNTFTVSGVCGGGSASTSGTQSGIQSVGFLSSQIMTVNANFVTTYNPVSHTAEKTVMSPTTNMQCAVNKSGAGGYDGTGPFSAATVAWLYYIWGSSLGINCVWSTNGPTTGPTLPSGYTSYAPVFPLKFFGSVTLLPVDTSSGYTTYQVRGNHVNLPGRPIFIGAGYPGSSFNYSGWVPNAYALETSFILDAELQGTVGAGVIGGAIASFESNNVSLPQQFFQNISLYPSTASPFWAAQDVPVTIGLQNIQVPQQMWLTFLVSSGVVSNSAAVAFLTGYTFGE